MNKARSSPVVHVASVASLLLAALAAGVLVVLVAACGAPRYESAQPPEIGSGEAPGTTVGALPDGSAPRLSIADARLTEGSGDGSMDFAVTLAPAGELIVTVDYATADGTATAGADYTSTGGTLTFGAATTERTISVSVLTDDTAEDDETFTVTLSGATNAGLANAAATGTIVDQASTGTVPSSAGPESPASPAAPLELSSLQVSGAGSMYPAFDPDIHHYAMTCSDPSTLQVEAEARRPGVRPTLLRADATRNVVAATESLSASVTVNQDHDIAVELSDDDGGVTYVVHCLPAAFPDVKVLKKTDNVSPGLLLVNPAVYWSMFNPGYRYIAIMDNNGVPRFHRKGSSAHGARNFRYHANGPVVDGKTVKYTHGAATLLDQNLEEIRSVAPVAPLKGSDGHEFLITDSGNYVFMTWQWTWRDLSGYNDKNGDPYPSPAFAQDSIIQMRTPGGKELFRWNSWDHLKLTDCLVDGGLNSQYAHLNSMQIVDGDIVASFRGCAQVARIDRSNDGTLAWKLGGTAPARSDDTEYLEIVNDEAGEFCGQHQATLTADEHVVLFDNGNHCLGARKAAKQFTRVVEYDISSGTQAAFVREYRRAAEQGVAPISGGVTVLDNGHWLIAWGFTTNATVGFEKRITISEVAPATGTSVFELNLSKSHHTVSSYRVYRVSESDVQIPLNLP